MELAMSGKVDDDSRPLLFSAQFFLGSVGLQLPHARCTDLLVGFQLLQYEIVLFDAARITASADKALRALDSDTSHIALTLEHGKSCLFDADADVLAADLQRTCDAPLALMVMQQEHRKARLVAFASVPIELHAGLLHTSIATHDSETSATARLSDAMRYRVCEWASSSGSWELRNHANQVVGVATGAVTLSCLGRTLAPHIAHAIGLRVDRAVLPDQCVPPHTARSEAAADASDAPTPDSALDCAHKGSSERATVSEPAASEEALQHVHTVDTAVQCDDERFASDEDAPGAPLDTSVRATASSNSRVFPAIVMERTSAVTGAASRPTRTSRARAWSLSSPRAGSHSPRTEQHVNARAQQPQQRRVVRGDAFASALELFAPALPPPLFFEKPKASRKT